MMTDNIAGHTRFLGILYNFLEYVQHTPTEHKEHPVLLFDRTTSYVTNISNKTNSFNTSLRMYGERTNLRRCYRGSRKSRSYLQVKKTSITIWLGGRLSKVSKGLKTLSQKGSQVTVKRCLLTHLIIMTKTAGKYGKLNICVQKP